MRNYIVLLFSVFILSSCANSISANVTRYYDPALFSSDRSFAIIPNHSQVNNLEYQQYATIVLNHLIMNGFTPKVNSSEAKFHVQLDYNVGPGEEKGYWSPQYQYIPTQTYNKTQTISSTYNPYNSVNYTSITTIPGQSVYVGDRYQTYTIYPKYFTMTIVDRASASKRKLFQGTVRSRDSYSQFSSVARGLIDAMFKNFPGENGQTITVTINK